MRLLVIHETTLSTTHLHADVFAERKKNGNTILIKGHVMHLYLQDLVRSEKTEVCSCIDGLQQPPHPTTTPVVKLTLTLCYCSTGYVRLNVPVAWLVVVVVELAEQVL